MPDLLTKSGIEINKMAFEIRSWDFMTKELTIDIYMRSFSVHVEKVVYGTIVIKAVIFTDLADRMKMQYFKSNVHLATIEADIGEMRGKWNENVRPYKEGPGEYQGIFWRRKAQS